MSRISAVRMLSLPALMLALTFYYHLAPSWFWLWMLPLWALYIAFVCGISLLSSAVSVYVRDTQYVVESFNVVLFWLVPIFYSFDRIPAKYSEVYELNPVAALVLCLRNILLGAIPPPSSTVLKLAAVSFVTFGLGFLIFRWGKTAFYDHI